MIDGEIDRQRETSLKIQVEDITRRNLSKLELFVVEADGGERKAPAAAVRRGHQAPSS
jgi:hypothetical protein